MLLYSGLLQQCSHELLHECTLADNMITTKHDNDTVCTVHLLYSMHKHTLSSIQTIFHCINCIHLSVVYRMVKICKGVNSCGCCICVTLIKPIHIFCRNSNYNFKKSVKGSFQIYLDRFTFDAAIYNDQSMLENAIWVKFKLMRRFLPGVVLSGVND